jgi:aspartate-semialdehyde dehydrogenase
LDKPKLTSQIALVGGETLLGRELQEVLANRHQKFTLSTYGASGEGNFGEQEGEAVYVAPLTPEEVKSALAVVVAGTAPGAEKAYEIAKAGGGQPKVIDCTGLLESHPEARIFAPLLDGGAGTWLRVIAHPAAIALAQVFVRLARSRKLQNAVVNVFEPASERGKAGISELHQQTTSLLAFKSLNKDVFDAQASFNLLSEYGEDAPAQLSGVEQRIERNLATLLSTQSSGSLIPMPSLRLVQAPVFHGYSMSAWVQFASDIEAEELGEALASAQIEVRGKNEESPTNVGAAGQSGVLVGNIRVDRNNPRAAWLWLVLDNLRMTADAAAECIAELGPEQP